MAATWKKGEMAGVNIPMERLGLNSSFFSAENFQISFAGFKDSKVKEKLPGTNPLDIPFHWLVDDGILILNNPHITA